MQGVVVCKGGSPERAGFYINHFSCVKMRINFFMREMESLIGREVNRESGSGRTFLESILTLAQAHGVHTCGAGV